MRPTTIEKNILFENLTVTVFNHRMVFPDGAETTEISVEPKKKNGDAQQFVAVLPVLKSGEIALIKRYFPSIDKELWVAPQSEVDRDVKDIEDAARHTARSVANVQAEATSYLRRFIENPTLSKTTTHGFVAKNCTVLESGITNNKAFFLTEKQIEDMMIDGRIADTITLLLITHYLNTK